MSQRKYIKPLAAVVTIAAVALVIRMLMPGGLLDFNLFGSRQVLTGNTPAVLTQSTLERHADDNQVLQIAVGLKLRNEAELEALIVRLNDPASPQFGQYLSTDAFVERFSPVQGDVDHVIAYLQSHRIKVLSVSPNRLIIAAEGTVKDLESAFGVKINRYTIATAGGAKSYLSNDRDPSVPVDLEPIVQTVVGLDTYAEFQSRIARAPSSGPQTKVVPHGFSPQDIARIYGFPSVHNPDAKVKLTGAGKTIAIATAYTYDPKDVQAFWKQYGITRSGKLVNIYVGGTAKKTSDETTLDLEAASSQAPGADILMYMAKDSSFVNFTKVFNQVVSDNRADIMTVSWGLCEEHTGKRQMKLENSIFKEAAAQGIAVFASSGDDGAYDCRVVKDTSGGGNGGGKVNSGNDGGASAPGSGATGTAKSKVPDLAVDYPSSDPYVTAVGGTTLFDKGGKRSFEWAWRSGGGGDSKLWKRPTWQHGPGVPSGDMRATSDVSLVADPVTGYAIFYDGKWITLGGTSVASPEWAALWALIDEGAGKRIGTPNIWLYQAGRSSEYGSLFYDITTGNNGDYRGPGFKAGPTWDHPTGWGVPNGEALEKWIAKAVKKP